MDPLIGSALVGLGGSIIGGIGQSITNQQNVTAQERINQKQLDFAREQTRAEFEYNSIGEQMKRAMQAGVNPMLLAGAQPTSASASSTPSLDAPVRNNPFASVPNSAMSIGNNILQAEQLELRDREIQLQSQKLSIEEFISKNQLLKTILDTLGAKDLTSSEVQQIMNDIFPEMRESVTLPELVRDNYITTKLRNGIEVSNIDRDTKKYLYGWVDEFTTVQYMIQTGQLNLQASQTSLNEALKSQSYAKVQHIYQAISNMREEFKVLEYQGKLSEEKAKYIEKTAKATVDHLVNLAGVSEQEAKYWVWKQVISNPINQSFNFLGIGGSKQDFPNKFDFNHVDNPLNIQ